MLTITIILDQVELRGAYIETGSPFRTSPLCESSSPEEALSSAIQLERVLPSSFRSCISRSLVSTGSPQLWGNRC